MKRFIGEHSPLSNNSSNYYLLTSFLCLFYVGLWMILFFKTPLGVRGFNFDGAEFLSFLASFCPSMPACFRVGSGVFYEMLVFVYQSVFDLFGFTPDLKRVYEVSSFLTVFLGLYGAFYLFFIRSTFVISLVGSLAFVLTPFTLGFLAGLVQYDAVVLFFWGLVIQFKPFEKSYFQTICFCFLGTLIFENTGIALALASFFYAVIVYCFKGELNKRYIWSSIIGLITCATTIALVFSIISLNTTNIFWVSPGKGFLYQYEMYGQHNNIKNVLREIRSMNFLPITLIAMSFSAYVIFLIKNNIKLLSFDRSVDRALLRNDVFLIFSYLLGFLTTLIPGSFLSGLSSEWTRQLLPSCYISSFLLISCLVWLKSELSIMSADYRMSSGRDSVGD